MTKRKQRQLVRNIKLYAVCGAMVYLAFGVRGLAGQDGEASGMTQIAEVATESPKCETEEWQEASTQEPEVPEKVIGQDLEYPFNQMSFDWSADQIDGFVYHEISDECKQSGGYFPMEMQMYTYIVCQNSNVDYEIVFALIEKESSCRYDAVGDDGCSVGYMQLYQKWHTERMEELNCHDLLNPYQNVMVGVSYLAELQGRFGNIEDVLAAYNYGPTGAQKHLWSKGKHWYSYNEQIVERANELKAEVEVDD